MDKDTGKQRIAELEAEVMRLTEKLLQSEKLASIGQLAAGVAHEINNPIGYVASNMKVLAEYSDSLVHLIMAMSQHLTPQQAELLQQQFDFSYVCADLPKLVQESEQGLMRVIEIIRALKDFSHLEEFEFVMADIQKGIDSTLNIVANELKYKAEIIKQYTELPTVMCIPAQINQVVMNILVNAAHAIEQFGRITISTGYDACRVWISINDTGKGMTASELNRIFEPFYTTKPRGQGTGLGLALSQSIIDKHKGIIEVSSSPGNGSCFTIFLPQNSAG
jgi:two-component system, NtrC family, sensor kinase